MPEPVLSSQKKRVWLNKPGEPQGRRHSSSVLQRFMSMRRDTHCAFCACGQAVNCCVLQRLIQNGDSRPDVS